MTREKSRSHTFKYLTVKTEESYHVAGNGKAGARLRVRLTGDFSVATRVLLEGDSLVCVPLFFEKLRFATPSILNLEIFKPLLSLFSSESINFKNTVDMMERHDILKK